MSAAAPDNTLELELLARGATLVAGCDEVGRGAACGPVTVGAVIAGSGAAPQGIRDSKLLRPAVRAPKAGKLDQLTVLRPLTVLPLYPLLCQPFQQRRLAPPRAAQDHSAESRPGAVPPPGALQRLLLFRRAERRRERSCTLEPLHLPPPAYSTADRTAEVTPQHDTSGAHC